MKTRIKCNKKIVAMAKRRKMMLRGLAKAGPFIEGSLTTVLRICGKKGCACERGKKHPAMFFTWKKDQVTQTLYVPVARQKLARECSRNYKKLKKMLRKLSDLQKKLLKTA